MKSRLPVWVAAACFAAVAVTTPAVAQKWVFITVDYGAEFEPRQLHDQLFLTADKDATADMMGLEDRDDLLRERFPELTLPSVGGTKSKLDNGYDAYMNQGDFPEAEKQLSRGLPEAYKMTEALSLRTEFAKLTYDSAVALAIIHSINGDIEGLGQVLQEMVRYFPSRPLTENEVPPDIVEEYNKIAGGAGKRHKLALSVNGGCAAHVNGIPSDSGNVSVLKGKYGITEVCDGQTTRAYVVDVSKDMTVDFQGRFAQLFTYPLSLSVKGKDIVTQPNVLGGVLAELGERLGVDVVMAAGLVPPAGEKAEYYYLVKVDVASKAIVGSIEVRPGEVATPERMEEAFLAMHTGSEFVHDEPPGPTGVDWTLIGGITVGVGGLVVIGGAILGVLANQAQDEFDKCNADILCIQKRGEREGHITDRNSFALGADIMYITGGVIVAGGVTLIVLDLVGVLSGEASSESAAERDWNMGVAPIQGGGFFEFQMRF